MSSFFKDQSKARQQTKLLLVLYIIAVALIILSIYLVALYAQNQSAELWNLQLFLKISFSVLAIIGIATYFKFLDLRSGGKGIALMLGGELIRPDTKDSAERKILNVVEELAIASGLKVPPVYLLKREKSINAFAAGTNASNAIIGVSQGAIELLSRDELQGVIAHEFSHIFNGDMALNLRLIGVLYGIIFIASTGQFMFQSGISELNSHHGGPRNILVLAFGLVGISLIIIGYTGVFFANLIKMAISRQREFLADASAVQFTRHPQGLASALKKIGGLAEGSKIKNFHADETSHLFFAEGLNQSFHNLFSTHPPLIQRIKKLDPQFDGMYLSVNLLGNNEAPTNIPSENQEKLQTNNKILGLLNTQLAAIAIQHLPQNIYDALHEPYKAPLIIYTLLLDQEPAIRKKQLAILEDNLPSAIFKTFSELLITREKLSKQDIITITSLILPTLNFLSLPQLQQMKILIKLLSDANHQIDLYECLLELVLVKQINLKFYPEKISILPTLTSTNKTKIISDFLLCLAFFGNQNDSGKALASYQTAASDYGIPHQEQYSFDDPLPPVNLKYFNQAFEKLYGLSEAEQEKLYSACLAGIQADKLVTSEEKAIITVLALTFDQIALLE